MKWKSLSSQSSTLNSKSSGNLRAAALITAAGTSKRMGKGVKKEFLPLNGKPVLFQTVDLFLQSGFFSICAVTYGKEEESVMTDILQPYLADKRVILVRGGATRQKSVLNGLEGLDEYALEYVLIHDGARPWVSAETIRLVLEKTAVQGAAAPVVPAVNALKIIDDTGVFREHLSRDSVMGVQTPQGFRFSEILEAHKTAAKDGGHYIDDTEIYSRYCGDVFAVPGTPDNRKITYSHDIGEML